MNVDTGRIRSGALFGLAERRARILVVDDEAANRNVLLMMLARAGFSNVEGVPDVRSAVSAFDAAPADLAVIDLHLQDGSGLVLLRELRERIEKEDFFPVLVLTGNGSEQARDAALAGGATDFLTKPYDSTEILLRIHNLLRTRVLHNELKQQRNLLQKQYAERIHDLQDARMEVLERLARVAEQRDDGAFGHIRRVGELAARIAQEIGCTKEMVDEIRRAAPLHDVGKIGIKDEILLKPGPLDADEFAQQERHTLIGGHILGGGRIPVLRLAEDIALTHHERWDGKGYPHGLAGTAIPLAGRIVAVADAFDALTHPRPYKEAWSVTRALAEIKLNSGTRFDPHVVNGLARLVETGRFAIMAEAAVPAPRPTALTAA